jgi:hypothetical protein
MHIEELGRAVINPQLQQLLVLGASDVSQLTYLPHWKIASSYSQLQTTYTSFISPSYQLPTTAPQDKRILDIVTLHLKDTEYGQLADVTHMIKAYLKIGLSVFLLQLAALIGDSTDGAGKQFSTAQKNMVNKTTLLMVTKLTEMLPFTQNMWCGPDDACDPALETKVCASAECYTKAANKIMLSLLSAHFKDDPEVMEWLFPTAIVSFMVNVALRPWIIMMYVASFIPGPWNIRTTRAELSFYDARFARALVYKTVLVGLRVIGRLNLDIQRHAMANELLSRMTQLTTLMASQANTETGGKAMKDMYTRISGMSKKTKDTSQSLGATNSKLLTRRSHAMSMLENREADHAEMITKKRRMYAWIIAYAITVAVALFLISSGHHDDFTMLAMVVMLAVMLYLIGSAIRNAIQQRYS